MKILYVSHGHWWGSTWPYSFIDRYIIDTLRSLRHEVKVFDIFGRADILNHFFSKYVKEKNLTPVQHIALLEERASSDLPLEVIEFEPDLVLHICGRVSEKVLRALRKLKTKTAIWFLDDPQEIDFTSKKGLLYDYVFTVESAALDAHREAGSSNVEFIPLGCFSPVQKKMKVEDNYKTDICFIGVAFPSRVKLFDSMADFLKDYNVKIIGGGPNIGGTAAKEPWLWKRKLKRLDVLEKFVIDKVVPPDEAVKYYNGAKINLNIHRAPVDMRFEHGNKRKIIPRAINGRTFEIAGCAGFQLIDDMRSDVGRHFEVGKEIITYSDPDDLKKKIEYYLKHADERKVIAEAAQKKVLTEHTYEKRLAKIIKATEK